MRALVIPSLVTLAVVAAMLHQAQTPVPVLCEAPDIRLGEIAGYTSEEGVSSEAERTVLPEDTQIYKRIYMDDRSRSFLVSLVIGGESRSSIPRPEMCLPAQGFQMTTSRTVEVNGGSWHLLDVERRDASKRVFAYTFFNQEGVRTSYHILRIARDVWDRSIHGRINRWMMVTVNASMPDEAATKDFLGKLQEVVMP